MLVVTSPRNGCTPVDSPPSLPSMFDINITKSIALIRRYDCNFDLKVSHSCFWLLTCIIPAFSQLFYVQVLHAQQAGFSAAIIHNMYSDVLLHMDYSNGTIFSLVYIIRFCTLNTHVISFSHALVFLYFSETIAKEIMIPSVFTSYFAAQKLKESIIPEQGWVDNCSVFKELWGKLMCCLLSWPTELI